MSQIKNNFDELNNLLFSNIKVPARSLNKSFYFNSELDKIIIQNIIDFLRENSFIEKKNGKQFFSNKYATITIYKNGTITVQGKESKNLHTIIDFLSDKRTKKSYDTLKNIFQENHNKWDVDFNQFKKELLDNTEIKDKFELNNILSFVYSNDAIEIIDCLKLYSYVKKNNIKLLNFANIVRPLGIAYEGFMLKLLYNIGELPEDYFSKSEKIKSSKLGSYLDSKKENLKLIFPNLNRIDPSLIDLLKPMWQKSRNDLFHSDPINPPIILKFEDAEQIIKNIIQIMNSLSLIYKSQFDNLNSNSLSIIGIDESGKGDLFGPLVTVSVYVPANKELIDSLVRIGVKDSKSNSDKKNKEIFEKLVKISNIHYDYVIVKPEKYNILYDKIKNLNKLLAWQHARSLENLLNKLNDKKIKCGVVISDKFEDNELVEKSLMSLGKKVNLIKIPKAESNISVAVASIMARVLFLNEINLLSKDLGQIIPKGANNKVIDFAKKIKENGFELKDYAKLHFKCLKNI